MPAKIQCENCRRELGTQLKSCPRRDKDAGCPNQVEYDRLDSKGWFFFVLVGASSGLLSLTGLLIGNLPLWIELSMLPILILGVGLAISGIYLTLGQKTTIFNFKTGQTWQQNTLFGIPITQTITHPVESVPWLGSPGREMRYPASVAQLYKDPAPAELISTALLQLIAHKIISLGQIQIKPRIGRHRALFVFSPGEQYNTAQMDGVLENKLIDVITASTDNKPLLEYNQKFYPRSHRAALTLADFLLLVFEGHRSHPGNYLVDQLVGLEAASMGLGTIKGKLVRYLEPAPNTRGKIALDIRSTEQLHRDFWITYPEIARDLLMQIDLLIRTDIASGSVGR
jgi:hypothetical protein